MPRFLRYILEFIAAFVGVGIALGLLLVWRLNARPVSSDFLTPYIATGIESIVPGSEVSLGSTLLTWSGADRAVSVHAENVKIADGKGREIADIPSFDAKISVFGLMFAQFMPEDLQIDHPQIKLERNKNGIFAFGGMEMGGGAPQSGQDQLPETITSVLDNVTQHLSRAALMNKLAVTRAVFDIHDDVTQKNWSVSVPEISLTRHLLSANGGKIEYGALSGRMTVAVTQKDSVASVDVQYAYDPLKETHTLSTVFSDVTPAYAAGGHPETLGLGAAAIVDLPLTGKIKLTLDRNLSVQTATAKIHGDAGHFVYSDFWDAPCPVKSFDLNLDFDRDAKTLSVSDTHIDLGGPTLDLAVSGVPSAQKGKDIDFTASLKADSVPMNSYGALWPKPILPDPRYWLLANLRDGTFTHAEVALKGAWALNDWANPSIAGGGGKISAVNGRVIYLEGLPAVEGVDADAVFDLKKMDITITGGVIGALRLLPFTAHITGLADADQDIDIPLRISGPLPDILRLLDHQPLGYAKALGLSPDDIGGQIEGTVDFRFPLLKTLAMKDMAIHATADATSIASTKLVPGITVSQGAFATTLDTSGFSLKGKADLNKLPFHIVWQENFESKPGRPLRHITVTGAVRDSQWDNFGITAFDGTKGPIDVSLDITNIDRKKMTVDGALNMVPASVRIGMLDWTKPANVPATLKFSASATSGKPVAVSSLSLRGPQIMADGSATLSPDMSRILSADFEPLIVGRTNVTLHFKQTTGPDGALRFDAQGAALDVSGLQGGKDPGQADPRPKKYVIQVDKLYTSDFGKIEDAKISASRDKQGWQSISLHGLADGDTPLDIELSPQPDGHRTFTISSDDFGKTMKGLGFTDTVKGGRLSVIGQSAANNPRVITGKIKIGDFTVEKLPVLALLLNATSPFGFTGLLTDSADFSHFRGDFRWQGDELTLTDAHAAGSAIGINIDGKVNIDTGAANLQGTLVPFSVVNKVLNYIPLIGDILTGGENQGVLAVAYKIKGTLAAPKIDVNPVSLLTPGFLRNLFFPDDASDEKSK